MNVDHLKGARAVLLALDHADERRKSLMLSLAATILREATGQEGSHAAKGFVVSAYELITIVQDMRRPLFDWQYAAVFALDFAISHELECVVEECLRDSAGGKA